MDQLDRHPRQPIGQPAGIAIVEGNVLAFQVAEIAQAVPERIPDGRVVDDANTRNLRGLLRRCRKRPCDRRTTEQRDEVASSHSITSSARASSVGGTSRPSAFAVLRLITSSYLVGACTGRSAGFSPLRMRST